MTLQLVQKWGWKSGDRVCLRGHVAGFDFLVCSHAATRGREPNSCMLCACVIE
jgi:hypothetical protein